MLEWHLEAIDVEGQITGSLQRAVGATHNHGCDPNLRGRRSYRSLPCRHTIGYLSYLPTNLHHCALGRRVLIAHDASCLFLRRAVSVRLMDLFDFHHASAEGCTLGHRSLILRRAT